MKGFPSRVAVCLLCLSAIVTTPAPVYAVEPDEMLADPKLEARARNLSLELRCLVCQNQSIDDSNAPLARDLRILVRERIAAGDGDEETKAFIVRRFGTFVLLKPPFEWDTLLLWLTPLMALGAAALVLWRRFNPGPDFQPSTGTSPLTSQEEDRLAQLLLDPPLEGAPERDTARRK